VTGFQSKRNATRDLLTYRYPRTMREAFPLDDPDTWVDLHEPDEPSLFSEVLDGVWTLCAMIGVFAVICMLAGYAWHRSAP
jgi:hypothetical protein